MLRRLLVEAGQSASPSDPELRRRYQRLKLRRVCDRQAPSICRTPADAAARCTNQHSFTSRSNICATGEGNHPVPKTIPTRKPTKCTASPDSGEKI